MKRLLAVAIIILFFGMIIFPSSGIQIEQSSRTLLHKGNTLYVGGNGSGNYSKIQDAVDNASGGDTVYVFNGTYYENVKVNKTINLIGEDKNTTFIDGMGLDNAVIRVNNDYVNITGFTIQHGRIGILSYSNFNKYYNNVILNNYYGISLFYHLNDNKESNSNKIYTNIIKNNNVGIRVDAEDYLFAKARFNKIYNNVIYNNINHGLIISGCDNTISRNHISYNGLYGYYIAGGISVDYIGNKILNNNISNNEYGITITLGLNNLVKNNNFINNVKNAYFMDIWFRLPNRWRRNYWDDWGGVGPKIIHGEFFTSIDPYIESKPAVSFDWFPARHPYDITDTSDIIGCGIV